jgi:hypothetical protein
MISSKTEAVNFGFINTQGVCWPSEHLLASKVGLDAMEVVIAVSPQISAWLSCCWQLVIGLSNEKYQPEILCPLRTEQLYFVYRTISDMYDKQKCYFWLGHKVFLIIQNTAGINYLKIEKNKPSTQAPIICLRSVSIFPPLYPRYC